MMITEKCPCGAEISVAGSEYRNDKHPQNPRGADEVVERWRETHRHDMPAAAPESQGEEPPHIFESVGSSVERSWSEPSEVRPMVTLGFQRY